MTIKRYAGDKLVGLSSDTKPTNIPDGATFYESNTLKLYLLNSGSWTELVGATGFTGSQGSIGYTGSKGDQGVIGYTGSKGDQGVIGYTGSQGTQGVIGYTGSQGIQGVIGYTGSRGATGFTGSQGIQGIQGFTGSQGIQGVIGYTGSRGATGFTGSQGIQGVIGYTGSQGIQGVIGYTGSRGATGFTGSQGIQGVIGFTGSKGDQGVIGYTGSQGIQGVIGYTGSRGATGFTGSQGIQGVIGYTGSKGPTDYNTHQAQYALSGGGTVTWTGSYIKWDTRVIAIPVERTEFGSAGYIDINCPTSGTVTYYNSGNTTTTVTCTADGVPLADWEALWYQVTPGQSATSVQSQFRVTNFGNSTWDPGEGWILIATHNGDTTNGHLKWLPGQINFPNSGGIYYSGLGTNNWTAAGSVTTSTTAPSSPSDGDLWWNEEEGQLKIYYDDGNTAQWVDASSSAVGYTGSAGASAGSLLAFALVFG